MNIKFAEVSDALIVYELLMQAFSEYKDVVPPSSALNETVQSIAAALETGEQALIAYLEEKPVGMVRFQMEEVNVYFYRLSVIPEKQGQGIAKELLKSLERYAIEKGKLTILCDVRKLVPKNIKFYSSLGYDVYDEKMVHNSNGANVNIASMKKTLI